ncbi:MAG: CYTH domain-containing protein [Clostridia bacterium]|nr:CYTH domain-containing protein [Clostridia bacterium]
MNDNKCVQGAPVEIERKFLIAYPDVDFINNIEGCTSSKIEQVYVTGGGRARKRLFDDGYKYYFTVKRDVTAMTRIEIESEITRQEYEEYCKNILEGTYPIRKTRFCIPYKGLTLEIDLYDFSSEFATLETELKSEEQSVELPDYIKVIADVTSDKRYRNFSIARTNRFP